MTERLDGVRIIIVGAGIAGLAAARDAMRRGADVLVFEARDRIGGRILTDRNWGIPIDLGAAAIHGADGNPLTQLAGDAAAVTRRLDYASIHYHRSDGSRVAAVEARAAAERFDAVAQAVRDAAVPGESLAAAMARLAPAALSDPLLALHAGVEFEFDIGASLAEIGVAGLDDHRPFGGGDLFLPGGYDQLVSHLARGIDIRCGSSVQSIALLPAGIHVAGPFGTATADLAICTLPIGVLQAGAVRFEPALPAPLAAAIDRIGAGHVTKVVLGFDRCFWDVDVRYIGFASGSVGRFPWFLNVAAGSPGASGAPGANVLIGFALGDAERAMRAGSDRDAVAAAAAALRSMFGSATAAPVRALVTRWQDDPFSRCSYSFAAPATRRTDFAAFDAIVHDRLAFAGEHTIAEQRGTAHGALHSGLAAVARLAATASAA